MITNLIMEFNTLNIRSQLHFAVKKNVVKKITLQNFRIFCHFFVEVYKKLLYSNKQSIKYFCVLLCWQAVYFLEI